MTDKKNKYWATNKLKRAKGRTQQSFASNPRDFGANWLNWAIDERPRRAFPSARAASECVSLDAEAKAEIAKRLGVEVKR